MVLGEKGFLFPSGKLSFIGCTFLLLGSWVAGMGQEQMRCVAGCIPGTSEKPLSLVFPVAPQEETPRSLWGYEQGCLCAPKIQSTLHLASSRLILGKPWILALRRNIWGEAAPQLWQETDPERGLSL